MKPKLLKLTAFLLIFAGAFTACNGKEPSFLNIDPTTITASAEGGIFTISVSTNGEWTAVVQDTKSNLWLTLTASGTNDGVITVSIAENPYLETRNATIKISMGSLSKIVLVKQEEPEKISLANTQWRLAGFVDKQTGTLRVPEPLENCFLSYTNSFGVLSRFYCFTIIFEKDRLHGFSTSNFFSAYYEIDYEAQRIRLLSGLFATEAGERSRDGSLFIWAIRAVHSFNLQGNELRLFSTIPENSGFRDPDIINNNYLLLKRIEL